MINELVSFNNPKSPISESFRTLRTNIQFMDIDDDTKVILISSAFSGEGKSWISANLAVSFAQMNLNVLLIDADMRRGRQNTIFNVLQKPGLSNYLAGKDNRGVKYFISETKMEKLKIMPSGNWPPNPSELLNSKRMSTLLSKMKNFYDIIILDGAPTQIVSDSLVLARMVDATVIVTACKQTKKEDIKKVITDINNVGGKILGVVLNKIPIETKKYRESYYDNMYLDKEEVKEEKNEKHINSNSTKITNILKSESKI